MYNPFCFEISSCVIIVLPAGNLPWHNLLTFRIAGPPALCMAPSTPPPIKLGLAVDNIDYGISSLSSNIPVDHG